MDLWRYVWERDTRHDLTDLAEMAAFDDAVVCVVWNRKWEEHIGSCDRPHPRWEWSESFPPPDEASVGRWRAAVHALRSLVPRLRGLKGRPSDLKDDEADRVFREHIGCLQATVVTTDEADFETGERPAMTAGSFAGVEFSLTLGRAPGVSRPGFGDDAAGFAYARSVFWGAAAVRTFAYLAGAAAVPVCESCCRPLGMTTKRRPRRARFCHRCRQKQWESQKPRDEVRASWKARKAAERARNKGG